MFIVYRRNELPDEVPHVNASTIVIIWIEVIDINRFKTIYYHERIEKIRR